MSDCLVPSILLLEQFPVEIHVRVTINHLHIVGTLCGHF